jgi:hypothetical protein
MYKICLCTFGRNFNEKRLLFRTLCNYCDKFTSRLFATERILPICGFFPIWNWNDISARSYNRNYNLGFI